MPRAAQLAHQVFPSALASLDPQRHIHTTQQLVPYLVRQNGDQRVEVGLNRLWWQAPQQIKGGEQEVIFTLADVSYCTSEIKWKGSPDMASVSVTRWGASGSKPWQNGRSDVEEQSRVNEEGRTAL